MITKEEKIEAIYRVLCELQVVYVISDREMLGVLAKVMEKWIK